jgi:hypothetical protein
MEVCLPEKRLEGHRGEYLTHRVLGLVRGGLVAEDLYVIALSGEEDPLVLRHEDLMGLIEGAPDGMIRETLTRFSERDKESGSIRLLLLTDAQTYFGQTKIPKAVVEIISEIKKASN